MCICDLGFGCFPNGTWEAYIIFSSVNGAVLGGGDVPEAPLFILLARCDHNRVRYTYIKQIYTALNKEQEINYPSIVRVQQVVSIS